MVETERTQSAGVAESDLRKQVAAQRPGRHWQHKDIAGGAVFLASADTSWITGQTPVPSGNLRHLHNEVNGLNAKKNR